MSNSYIRLAFMSTADQLRAEGALEVLREILLKQLEIKFGRVDRSMCARVEQAPLDQLKAWMRRIVVVATVGEVFEG